MSLQTKLQGDESERASRRETAAADEATGRPTRPHGSPWLIAPGQVRADGRENTSASGRGECRHGRGRRERGNESGDRRCG